MISELIRKMHEAGASIEAIIAAVEVVEEDQNRRRARTAERVRNHRKRNVTLHNVTPTPSPHPPSFPPRPPITPPLPPIPTLFAESNDSACANSKKRTRTDYPEIFDALWKAYPTDANMSKREAFDVWKRMPEDRQKAAQDSVPAFKAYCSANPEYRPIHLNRYLSKERYQGHLDKGRQITARTPITPDHPAWDIWRTYYRDNKKGFSIEQMEHCARDGKPYIAPSLYPPGHHTNGSAAPILPLESP